MEPWDCHLFGFVWSYLVSQIWTLLMISHIEIAIWGSSDAPILYLHHIEITSWVLVSWVDLIQCFYGVMSVALRPAVKLSLFFYGITAHYFHSFQQTNIDQGILIRISSVNDLLPSWKSTTTGESTHGMCLNFLGFLTANPCKSENLYGSFLGFFFGFQQIHIVIPSGYPLVN